MQGRALLLTAPRHLEWVVENLPPLQAGEVLVQTREGAISSGAELPQYLGTARSSEEARYPRMTGYESVGTVIDCGPDVQRLHIGDRVVAFYGHRTHAIVPENKAILVPGDISDALALLVILTCDAAKGIRKVAPAKDEPVLITGAGAIGLLTIFMLRAYGVRAIDVVEPRAERRELALRLGARAALLPQEISGRSDAYPVGIECSSRSAAFELLQRKMQREGRICILADGNIEPLALAPAFHQKELTVVGSSDGWDYQEHAKWYFKFVCKHSHSLECLFDYQTTADELVSTFESLASATIVPTKVLVQY
ncbi:MAG: zinc-binding dehydrogenase [Chloroflexi bacterium]|nr:zinc-binding dehydrogenase [Chloroflexota bacterium]